MNKGKNKKMMRDKFGFSDEEDDFDEDEEEALLRGKEKTKVKGKM